MWASAWDWLELLQQEGLSIEWLTRSFENASFIRVDGVYLQQEKIESRGLLFSWPQRDSTFDEWPGLFRFESF